MTNYIDTHIHIDSLVTPEPMLEVAGKAGVTAWIVPGVSPDHWPKLMATTELHAGVYVAPGVHPQATAEYQSAHLDELRRLLEHPKAVALGEVGLDRQSKSPWQRQEKLFVQMIHLAREMNKPLLIHERGATARLLELIAREGAGQVSGIFHAFSGSLETAHKIIDLGFALGVGGVVTFPTARRLPKVVCGVPAETLVLETDAPYMTPEPYRTESNRPEHLVLIAERVATLRGWSLAETAQKTTANACRILGLPLPVAAAKVD